MRSLREAIAGSLADGFRDMDRYTGVGSVAGGADGEEPSDQSLWYGSA
jgi:hypothetical protein